MAARTALITGITGQDGSSEGIDSAAQYGPEITTKAADAVLGFHASKNRGCAAHAID